MERPPENVFRGDLIQFPLPWGFRLPHGGLIVVSDAQLDELCDPDRPVDLSLTHTKNVKSLRQVCEGAAARGATTLRLAFDHFFEQYRAGQGHEPRKLLPDTDEYIERVATIGRFAEEHGLGLELSLVTPLELGVGYRRATGETGRWVHYREGVRDPGTGAFTVQLWQHRRWGNNKGAFELERTGVRAFAFRETAVGGTHLFAVEPDSIVDVSDGISLDDSGAEFLDGDFLARRVTVRGAGPDVGPLDRVLVVLSYASPEMDYFSPKAAPFLDELLDRYHRAGVKLNALYADETHIQQDWHYFSHHEHGQFALRYVSDGFAAAFSGAYGERFRDFDRWLVYFCEGQHDFLPTTRATMPARHVFGPSTEAIAETVLFRARYYRTLEGGVVDLMAGAKRHAEDLAGHLLPARAHATWAESPTCDDWDPGALPGNAQKYEYTSAFRWSNTVHQASAACQDYFRWNDFLTGGGNDHAEGGYADRDYFGLALACSTGSANDVPYAYAAHWGMPPEIAERRQALVDAFGANASPGFQEVEGSEHRSVDVLMLYPVDLVALDERFGSWTAQYGYANYLTAEKLLAEGGIAEDGALVVRDRRYTTLVALCEPVPSERLIDLMERFVSAGGRVVWSGPPPVRTWEGGDAAEAWSHLFGSRCDGTSRLGIPVPGRTIRFEGVLGSVPSQTILTDLTVDHIYPLEPFWGAEVVARMGDRVVATQRRSAGGGVATALGFRPRDDQSASLGEESRTWFAVLSALGAYPPTGNAAKNDNTESLSRSGPYLACRFPNGATAVARHFHQYEEGWPGGFAREQERDREWMLSHPLPTDRLDLRSYRVNGHRVTYRGRLAVAFRTNDSGDLLAFAGHGTREIELDGRSWTFAQRHLRHFSFAPVSKAQRVDGGATMIVRVDGSGTVTVPLPADSGRVALVAEGTTPGSRGTGVLCEVRESMLTFRAEPEFAGRPLYVIPA